MNRSLLDAVEAARTIGITGHLHPDGDCVGSCMALYRYITVNYPEKSVHLYLETPPANLNVLCGLSVIDSEFTEPDEPFDLFFVCDCSSVDRFPAAVKIAKAAKKVYVVDHHMTNTHFADEGVILPDASSTCEVLYDLLEDEKIDREIAECLYVGIVHDTGVFKYQACREHTMHVAGRMLSKGVNAQRLIDDSFYAKSYVQNRLIGNAVLHSQLLLDGKMIVSTVTLDDLAKFGATRADTEGVVDQLRLTKGISVALFARQETEDSYKISLRSVDTVNVAAICQSFGGGGHYNAAGCTVTGDLADYITQISAMVMLQI